jgi:DNA (cytosine-5)-methyltransferase 1
MNLCASFASYDQDTLSWKTSQHSNGLDIVLGSLAEAGYDTEWSCIRASDMGGSHRRDRWWLVAYSNSTGTQGLRPERELRETCEEVTPKWRAGPELLSPAWRSYISEPLLHRGDDGLSGRVDRLKSLGNSVVPQVAAIPLQRVLDLENARSL